MKILYLFCYKCGEIIGDFNQDQVSEFIKNGVECGFCKNRTRFKDCYYPHFSINDFINTTNKLYEQEKRDLTEEINSAYTLLNKGKDANEDFSLEEYTKIYHVLDHLLEDEVQYSIDVKSKVYDNLEDELVQIYPIKLAIGIVNSLHFIKTSQRKPIVILIASTIELLFNVYYKDAIKIGGIRKIKKNKALLLSLNKKIRYLDSNRTKSLKQYIKQYDKDFYILWDNLRIIRNKVIHSNSLYISNKMIEDYMTLLKASVTVFLKITSELYREHYINNNSDIIKN